MRIIIPLLLTLLLQTNARLLSILDPIFGGLWNASQLFGNITTKSDAEVNLQEQDLGVPVGQSFIVDNTSSLSPYSLMYFNSPLKNMSLSQPTNPQYYQNGTIVYQRPTLRKNLRKVSTQLNRRNTTNTSLINGTGTRNNTILNEIVNSTLNNTNSTIQNISVPVSTQPSNIAITETNNSTINIQNSTTLTPIPIPIINTTQTPNNITIPQKQQPIVIQQPIILFNSAKTAQIPKMQLYNQSSTPISENFEKLETLNPQDIRGQQQELDVEIQELLQQEQPEQKLDNDIKQN